MSKKGGPITMMRIELHGNWYNKLIEISNRLNNDFGIMSKVSMTNRETSKLCIFKVENFSKFKDMVKTYDLPVLERKWNKL